MLLFYSVPAAHSSGFFVHGIRNLKHNFSDSSSQVGTGRHKCLGGKNRHYVKKKNPELSLRGRKVKVHSYKARDYYLGLGKSCFFQTALSSNGGHLAN